MTNRQCDKCEFFVIKSFYDLRIEPPGLCRKEPKSISKYRNDWCGEFKEREEKDVSNE